MPLYNIFRIYKLITKYDNNAIKEIYTIQYDRKFGEYKEYHVNGSLIRHCFYINGKCEGFDKRNYASLDGQNQNIFSKKFYINDLICGLWKEYYDDGSFHQRMNYINNCIDGEIKEFHKNGIIMRSLYFVAGHQIGNITTYFPSGKVENKYIENTGENVLHAENGDILRRTFVINGKNEGFYMTYYLDKHIETRIFYVMGKMKEIKSYFSNGHLYYEYKYISSFPDGLIMGYHENNTIRSISYCVNGICEDESIIYDDVGQIIHQCYYEHGVHQLFNIPNKKLYRGKCSCYICRCNENQMLMLPCKHSFHFTCLQRWFVQSGQEKGIHLCPYCNQLINWKNVKQLKN